MKYMIEREVLKYKIGDRVKICKEASKHCGRVGTVTRVLTSEYNYPYFVQLDAADGSPEYKAWTNEGCLEPYAKTFRDRLKREHPECVDDMYIGGCSQCPYNYKYENKPANCAGINEIACRECWDRPIPTYIDTDNVGYTPGDITDCKRGMCKCGATVNSSYNFCPNCGIKLDWGE